MTTEEIKHENVILPVKRHINFGHESYSNSETTMYAQSTVSLEDQQNALRKVREELNTWELEERENFLDMMIEQRKQEKAIEEAERLENDRKDAELRGEILAFIEANPKCGSDDLMLTFELSRWMLQQHLGVLRNQGKVKTAQCRESFILGEEEEDEDLVM